MMTLAREITDLAEIAEIAKARNLAISPNGRLYVTHNQKFELDGKIYLIEYPTWRTYDQGLFELTER